MMKRNLLATVAAFIAFGVAEPALADGTFPGLPIEGGASYCASFSVTGAQCSVTVPAGNASPTGTEYLPTDLYGLSQTTNSQGLPQTQGIAASALGGFGPMVVTTTDAAATIANNTPNYIVNVAVTTGHAVTLPAVPQPWQLQRVSFTVAPTNSVSILANTGQTLVPATTSGTAVIGLAFLWNPTNSTWYRVQ